MIRSPASSIFRTSLSAASGLPMRSRRWGTRSLGTKGAVEAGERASSRQLAEEEQIGGLLEVRLRRQLLDGYAAELEQAALAVDVADRRLRGRDAAVAGHVPGRRHFIAPRSKFSPGHAASFL